MRIAGTCSPTTPGPDKGAGHDARWIACVTGRRDGHLLLGASIRKAEGKGRGAVLLRNAGDVGTPGRTTVYRRLTSGHPTNSEYLRRHSE